ncbi:hypothetical protein Apa02nite_010510 [Actinoplanes palleronii]|uniref:Uncharacterized protein n=1 Tax=Actinoplanes palleronii TaxID=113570 RepID=A0ABQ4B2R5_9ACTN|nr:hypothetical protein Apa02nite_010510 [Actinoplanes palleronii]
MPSLVAPAAVCRGRADSVNCWREAAVKRPEAKPESRDPDGRLRSSHLQEGASRWLWWSPGFPRWLPEGTAARDSGGRLLLEAAVVEPEILGDVTGHARRAWGPAGLTGRSV